MLQKDTISRQSVVPINCQRMVLRIKSSEAIVPEFLNCWNGKFPKAIKKKKFLPQISPLMAEIHQEVDSLRSYRRLFSSDMKNYTCTHLKQKLP